MLLFFILLIVGAFASEVEREFIPCNENIPIVSQFDMGKYTGQWYEIFRYHNKFQRGSDCITSRYTTLKDGKMSIRYTGVLNETDFKSMDGYMTLTDPTSSDAKFIATYPEEDITLPYWVVATDYETYSLVYSCTSNDTGTEVSSEEEAWIFSRTPYIDGIGILSVNSAIEEAGLSWKLMRPTHHTKNACGNASIQRLSIAAFLTAVIVSIKLF